jgi:hypothetical protein
VRLVLRVDLSTAIPSPAGQTGPGSARTSTWVLRRRPSRRTSDTLSSWMENRLAKRSNRHTLLYLAVLVGSTISSRPPLLVIPISYCSCRAPYSKKSSRLCLHHEAKEGQADAWTLTVGTPGIN